jgi:hypothetical protein
LVLVELIAGLEVDLQDVGAQAVVDLVRACLAGAIGGMPLDLAAPVGVSMATR